MSRAVFLPVSEEDDVLLRARQQRKRGKRL